jgi:Na+-driven multidrug efflux pump
MATWFGLLANVILIFVLYKYIGIEAAAWSMSIGYLIRFVVLAVFYQRVNGKGFVELFCLKKEDYKKILDRVPIK